MYRTKYNNIEKLKRIELNTQFDELSKLLSSGHKVSRRKMSSVTMLETAVKQVKSMQSIYKTYMKYKPYFHAIYLNKNFQNLITHVSANNYGYDIKTTAIYYILGMFRQFCICSELPSR